MNFYLWACARYNIYGVCAKDLHLIDVGKLDTIEQAEQYVSSMKCPLYQFDRVGKMWGKKQ